MGLKGCVKVLDYRLKTFITLCETMHYHKTADILHMTQPAVSQHIRHLEKTYGCKLFVYNKKKLIKTEAGKRVEAYARSAFYNETLLKQALEQPRLIKLRIGATKTIGEFVINDQVASLAYREDIKLELTIDNTQNLLKMLEGGALDFALIEGYFDKSEYGYKLYKHEPFVGLCAAEHPFAGKSVSMEALLDAFLLVREKGSGTRAIFEQFLNERNYTLKQFRRSVSISSFKLIKEMLLRGDAITFAYEAISSGSQGLSTFKVENEDIKREFNYVYLKNTEAKNFIDIFEGA
jgi:DNA-binding transcriptional LysR family regulator